MIDESVVHRPVIENAAFEEHAPLVATRAAGLSPVADRLTAYEFVRPILPTPTNGTLASAPKVLAYVHAGSAPAQPGSAPAWAHGMRDVVAGPVLDAQSVPIWTHDVPIPTWTAIRRGTNGPTLAFVQAATAAVGDGPGGHTITFGAGSIWIVASLFAQTSPADGFAGVAFDALTLTLAHAPPPDPSGAITIDIFATASFSLVPAPSVPVTLPGALANDGAAAHASLPATFAFALAPGGATVSRLDDAQLGAYGSTTSLHGGFAAVAYDASRMELAFTYAATSPTTFVPVSVATSAVAIHGSVSIDGGSYRLPVARTAASQLGAVANGGTLGLAFGAGLLASFGSIGRDLRVGAGLLAARSGELEIGAASLARGVVDRYDLWTSASPPTPPRLASLAFRIGSGARITSFQNATMDVFGVSGCTLEANVDRPLTVDGRPGRYAKLTVGYLVERVATGAALVVFGVRESVTASDPPYVETFALENALFVTNGLATLFAFARLDSGRGVSGVIATRADLIRLLPTLPDPYIASYPRDGRGPLDDALVSLTVWTTPSDVTLAFALARGAGDAGVAVGAGANAPSPTLLEGGFEYALLDVSSRADQFGVSFPTQSLFSATVASQTLSMPGASFDVFTLPHVAWEAVLSDDAFDTATGVTTPQPRRYRGEFSPDDGDAATIRVPTQTLRPVEPLPALDALVRDYAAGANLSVSFTLPFGLTANVDSTAVTTGVPRPILGRKATTFGTAPSSLVACAQLMVAGGTAAGGAQIELPGSSSAPPAVPPAGESYAASMLEQDIADAYDGDFSGVTIPGAVPQPPRVPLERIDLSGYGASTFSRWKRAGSDTGIHQVRFDVIVGRTSYELVEDQSYLLPWFVPVVDTTIFARDAAGYVLRHNTGWVAKAPGTFAYPPGAWTIENGAILGVFEVRNIRPTGGADVTVPRVASPGSITYRPVYFDADVAVAVDPSTHGLRLDGAPPGGLLAATNVVGYLDLSVGSAPGLADAVALLARVAATNAQAAGGTIAARGTIASTGIGMTFTGFDVKATHDGSGLAAALRGTPQLSRDGAWSVTKRGAFATNAAPLDALAAVPLVRANAVPGVWRFADPEDVPTLSGTGAAGPQTVYGFVQSTGTQKLLLEHPAVTDGDALPLNFIQPVKFADVGSLLGIPGLLPDLGSLLDLGTSSGLVPSGDGFAMQTPGSPQNTISKTLTIDDSTLIPLGPVSVHLSSAKGTQSTIDVTLDASGSPRWQAKISNVAFKLVVDGWGSSDDPLVAVTATVVASDGAAPTLQNIAVDYGSALSIVKTVLTGIESFLAFLPGGMTGPPFTIDFAGSTLKIRESFALPTLPLGFGFLQDIALDMGFDLDVANRTIHFFVGVGDDTDPFHWLVSPLSGNGLIQLGATDQLGVRMQAGIGVGLGIDLLIASGSASIVLAVAIDTTQSPMVVSLLLTGNAQVDVLDGLASAALTLTAGVGIAVKTPAPPPSPITDPIDFVKATVIELSAEVQVAIHLSVCWVVHVDWSGSWNFSESISGSTLTSLI